jgi:hypothetical protein
MLSIDKKDGRAIGMKAPFEGSFDSIRFQMRPVDLGRDPDRAPSTLKWSQLRYFLANLLINSEYTDRAFELLPASM